MIQQVDSIDDLVLRCWKETCKLDVEAGGSDGGAGSRRQQRYVPASTIRSPEALQGASADARAASRAAALTHIISEWINFVCDVSLYT